MLRKKVKVRNTLNFDVKIKEGNAGVYAQKGIVKPGKTFQLERDVNATYREYVLITLPDNTELPVFSSDDLGEISKEIFVMQRKGRDPPEYYWEGDPITSKPSGKNKGGPHKKNESDDHSEENEGDSGTKYEGYTETKNEGDSGTKNEGDDNVVESCKRDQVGSGAETSSPGLFRRIGKALGLRK